MDDSARSHGAPPYPTVHVDDSARPAGVQACTTVQTDGLSTGLYDASRRRFARGDRREMVLPLREPFTTSQARAHGVTRRELAGPEFEQLFRGVHARRGAGPTRVLRAKAALLLHPAGAVASRSTAARVLGIPVPHDEWEHVTVASADDRRRRLGIRCHVAQLAAAEVRVVDGVRITSPERLFVDLAETLSLVDLVVAGDWMVRNRLLTVESLQTYTGQCRAAHSDAARRAAAYVRERVDSPMETRLRLLLVLAGLPEPEVNRDLRDELGFLMRLDLCYPELKLAIEYDGQQHLTSTSQWERDVQRRNDLVARGWVLITVTSTGIYRKPQETITRVWEALRARSRTALRRPSQEWRRHFAA